MPPANFITRIGKKINKCIVLGYRKVGEIEMSSIRFEEAKEVTTKMQRIEALLNDEKVDRVPLWFMMEGFCSKTVGYEISSLFL